MHTQPELIGRGNKRPQSASMRVSKDKNQKNKLVKRNKAHYDVRYTGEDIGPFGSAPDVKGGSGVLRDSLVYNQSQYNRSPVKIQK